MRTIAAVLRRVLKWAVISLGVLCVVLVIGGFLVFRLIVEPDSAKFGSIADEAKAAGRTAQTLPAVARPSRAMRRSLPHRPPTSDRLEKQSDKPDAGSPIE